MDKLYVYEGTRPMGIVDNADQIPIDEITRLAKLLSYLFNQELHLKPIHKDDFPFEKGE